MSLNIYLKEKELTTERCTCTCCDNEHTITFHKSISDFNITHNLGKMADALGIYGIVWRPEDNGITKAQDMVNGLSNAIDKLESCPLKYKQYEPENKWGTVESFLEFLKKYKYDCEKNPEAKITVWR